MVAIKSDKFLTIRQFFDYETWTYTYLLSDPDSRQSVLIDPVKEKIQRDLKVIREMDLILKYSMETHVHADHITGANEIRKQTGAQIVYGEPANVPCADIGIKDGQELKFGAFSVRALATPGHTDGCTSYLVGDRLFTGDALLVRGCGRTDFQQGSAETLYRSIHNRIFVLPDDTNVYPAHDYNGMTVSTVGEEKRFNPRLGNDRSLEEFVEVMNNLNLAKPKIIDVAVPANMKCGNEEEKS